MNQNVFPAMSPMDQYRFLRRIDPLKVRPFSIKADYVNKSVYEFFDLTDEKIKSKSRKRLIVEARQIAMWLMKKHCKLSLKRIGMYYGDRDHTTVIHSIKTVINLMETDPYYSRNVKMIEQKILY